MAFFDKVKDLTKQATEKVDDLNQKRQDKKLEEYENNKDNPEFLFKSTTKVGDLEVDSINHLFRVKNAKSDVFEKKKGLFSKAGSAALAVGTVGLSTAVKSATKAITKNLIVSIDLMTWWNLN